MLSYSDLIYIDIYNHCLLSIKASWSTSASGEVYSMQLYVIQFDIDIRKVDSFLECILVVHPMTELKTMIYIYTHNVYLLILVCH